MTERAYTTEAEAVAYEQGRVDERAEQAARRIQARRAAIGAASCEVYDVAALRKLLSDAGHVVPVINGGTYEMPWHGWTCFHCGETFTDPDLARKHFGMDPKGEPACGELKTMGALQKRVGDWMLACFGEEIAADVIERSHRFIEEALELAQARGMSKAHAIDLVEYVYGRPPGDVAQEVGGVMITLAALCNTDGVDIEAAAFAELERIWRKLEQIRAKQASKPHGSALPAPSPATLIEEQKP